MFLSATTGAIGQFIQNNGQWDDAVKFKLNLSNGAIWFEDDGWKITTFDSDEFEQIHDLFHHGENIENEFIRAHCVKHLFKDKNEGFRLETSTKRSEYHNYFIGNDRSQWAGNVPLYDTLNYLEIYDGIDAQLTISDGQLKVTYVVHAGADLNQLRLEYAGNRGLSLDDDALNIKTSVGIITERELFAFQKHQGETTEVACRMRLNNGQVKFSVPEYDDSKTLYVDPLVVASTNSGSTAMCFGHTATFDNPGNIYAAGRCFGVGYPTDTGSFQMNIATSVDNAISKYNPDGSSLIYATYLGGDGTDLPHSMFVNSQGLLHVLGSSTSTDFPVSINAYDTVHNGGNDIVVTIFEEDGTDIVGSTYIGGAGSDGVNTIPGNYGDNYRGEIVADGYNSVYVSTMSSSTDFPVTSGVYQDTLNFDQDAIVMKLNFNLSQITFATYIGGAGKDVAYGIKVADDLSMYVSGSTQGQGFPEDSNGAEPTYIGGDYDGYVLHLSDDGTEVLHASYFGSASKDQNFFVEIDQQGFVYLFGQSNGSIASDSGKYEGISLGSYIYRTSPELDTIYWQSGFGNMAPVAFLVDLCSYIYVAGHGALGALTAANLDTLDAVLPLGQAGFYLMALSPEATSIEFGSFYGNNGSHVDGGTSRFDKRGFVYTATCSNGVFPNTSTAYSVNNQTGTWDVTVFKIDFEVDGVVAYGGASPGNVGCVPFTVDFTNSGSTGAFDFWDFGDGTTSNDSTPVHTYDSVGVYEVMYVKTDTLGCNLEDTFYLYITVLDTLAPEILIQGSDCQDSIRLSAITNYSNILWSTGATTTEIWVDENGTYAVEVSNACGVYEDSVVVDFNPPFYFELIDDTGICDPNFQIVGPAGAADYLWSTGDTTQNLTIPTTGLYSLVASNGVCSDTDSVFITVSYTNINQSDTVLCVDSTSFIVDNSTGSVLWSTGDTTDSIVISNSGQYWVRLENGYCVVVDTIDVLIAPLNVSLPGDTAICSPITIDVADSLVHSYLWSDGNEDSVRLISDPGVYWVEVNNGVCFDADTMTVQAIVYTPSSDNNQSYCDTLSAPLAIFDRPEADFLWSTGDTTRAIIATESGRYYVTISEGLCQWKDTFNLVFGTSPDIDIQDYDICEGDSLVIAPDTSYSNFVWSNASFDKSIVIRDSGSYWVSINNKGCETREEFHVGFLDASRIGAHSIQNFITPNGDGINDALFIDVNDYTVFTDWELNVYNRWGTLVYYSTEPTIRWEGRTFNGQALNPGVYYYMIDGNTICLQKETVGYRGSITILK